MAVDTKMLIWLKTVVILHVNIKYTVPKNVHDWIFTDSLVQAIGIYFAYLQIETKLCGKTTKSLNCVLGHSTGGRSKELPCMHNWAGNLCFSFCFCKHYRCALI